MLAATQQLPAPHARQARAHMHLSAPAAPRVLSSTASGASGAAGRLRCRCRCRAAGAGAATAAPELVFRQATAEDMEMCRRLVLEERMNPLGLDQSRLLIAATAARGEFVGMGQVFPLAPGVSELRSIVVAPPHRGRGAGAALVRRLCEGPAAAGEAVVLTTIGRRRAFYERAGFEEAPFTEAPREMWFELMAGTVAARVLAGDRLVLMRRRRG
ncbi:hypothetical protein Rsub_08340 [Raphidocelis subcapitata]|uniref:N-acetyltransferase domain-containing protein n=1 Tax=Raphidocelis subcapitata TaxID=307507 RepID=A0A2V0P6W4_9CHLO|nr:hypothetical protein Rsub_08340 [Raphidocelis subcapitata]|eukprot:GBF95309.1 hypothetical protein Rsub_08340 [Raphidocelis subcapitata]